jgi:hypothetical protein
MWDIIKNMVLSEDAGRHVITYGRLPPNQSLLQNSSLYQGKEQLSLQVGVADLLAGAYTGQVAFPKNNSQIWDILNQQVLARTTMSNDPITRICTDAQARIEALLREGFSI